VLYEYRENPGGHDWVYWDREIKPLLAAMQEQVLHPAE
jgi:enterochelin esterase-like enzyme